MAAIAYLFPPITGLLAYLRGGSPRTRWHGLQAVALGLIWPLVLYACSLASSGFTQAAFAGGILTCALFVVAVAVGKDPALPFVGRWLQLAAREDPRARNSSE